MCVLFLDESFNFPLFSCVLRVKNSMPIPFPGRFWLVDMWKCATKQKLLHIKKGNASGNEITQYSCIKSKTRGKLATLQEACKRKVSEFKYFQISHFILNLIPRVSCLHDSFDDNEDLLCGHQYREGKRPGNFMLSTNRQFLIPKKKKKVMNLLTDRDRSISLYLYKFLKIAGTTLENCQKLSLTSSQYFRELISEWFLRRRRVLNILQI